jgi:hypothetical protein
MAVVLQFPAVANPNPLTLQSGGHMSSYHTLPTEHDGLGTVLEPDRACTTVLSGRGSNLCSKMMDTNLDGFAEPDSGAPSGKFLAPGCTSQAGRELQGLCGLSTTTGTGIGIDQGYGPGITGKGARTVRFLDARASPVATAGVGPPIRVDSDGKVRDSGAQAALGSVDLVKPVAPGPQSVWAWYGTWSDRNGNGIVDHLGAGNGNGVSTANEFVWNGRCAQGPSDPDGGPATPSCAPDPDRPTAVAFVYPGNHHGSCGGMVDPLGITCAIVPADAPGRQAVAAGDVLLPNAFPLTGCSTFFYTGLATGCANRIGEIDAEDEVGFGDPLLGEQQSLVPDGVYNDATGASNSSDRNLFYGMGWPTWFYDDSTLITVTFVSALGCPVDVTNPNRVVLAGCRFVDIDHYGGINPTTEDLLTKTVKPVARSNWVTVRDGAFAPAASIAQMAGSNAAPEAAAIAGTQDDALFNPGWSREPNAPGDSYPGATRAPCTGPDAGERTHRGWCNSYADYRSGRMPWTDMQAAKTTVAFGPVGIGGTCVICTSGTQLDLVPPINMPRGGAFPAPAGDHVRTLAPGGYYFRGYAGLWQDRAQTYTETYFDPATLGFRDVSYTRPADGWVGNVVNATATFAYKGYADTACATEAGTGTHSYAACNPFLDGAVQDPQQAGSLSSGEWWGRCVPGQTRMTLTLSPEGGTWNVPVLVYRDFLGQTGLQMQDWTGVGTPITMEVRCWPCGSYTTGLYWSQDMVYFPAGNLGVTVTATLEADIPLDNGATVHVRDVDVYRAWTL